MIVPTPDTRVRRNVPRHFDQPLATGPQPILQARQESNLQPPVLETGALPIELRTFVLPCFRVPDGD